ncbi:MAG: ATP-binding protein [Cytophaga sp.]|uniref:DNA polymerase III subunit n=1 Tax=Cytophaga sp. TaxID=29535 RepID=UPI003F7ED122
MQFSQIPGLQEVKTTLINSVTNNHVAHAQLFAGVEGSAALPLALAYATYVNCLEKVEGDSCGNCSSCSKYNKLIHPDLHIIFPVTTNKKITKDASSEVFFPDWREAFLANPFFTFGDWMELLDGENKQLLINVEESRTIVKKISMKAFEAEYKVVIIWLPETMRAEGANALLKSLEEPPAKTLFLLVTAKQEKLLTTIISRTQRVQVRLFNDAEIRQYLIEEKGISEAQAKRVTYLADGNMREAIQLLSEEDQDHESKIRDWFRACFASKLQDMIRMSEEFGSLPRELQKSLLQYGLGIFRDSLMYKEVGTDLLRVDENSTDNMVQKFSQVIDFSKVLSLSQVLNDAHAEIERNINSKMVFMDTSFQMNKIFKQK